MTAVICTLVVLLAIGIATLIVIATRPPAPKHRSTQLPSGNLKAMVKTLDRHLEVVDRGIAQLVGEAKLAPSKKTDMIRVRLERKSGVVRHLRRDLAAIDKDLEADR